MVFVGDDWAKDHHDVELVDDNGRRLARARLPEGMDGVSRLHALIAEHAPPQWADLDPDEVAARGRVGIETDRGPWVQALVGRELGVNHETLRNWVNAARRAEQAGSGGGDRSGEVSAGQRDELRRLRKKVAELELEKEILRKAAQYFAKEMGR
jgi:transposase-like protein